VSVHNRYYAQGPLPRDTVLSELADARSRRLTQEWCKPATFGLVLDGRSPSAGFVKELLTDVIAWRWDDQTGRDVAMFRGPVGQSQDTISEQAASVTFTCHDYLAMLGRRFPTNPVPTGWSQWDQDSIATGMIWWSCHSVQNGNGAVTFTPADYLPIWADRTNPDGTRRGIYSGQIRDRVYAGGTSTWESFANLAAVVNGFDFDLLPGGDVDSWDTVRIFYPYQGVTRADLALTYGATVSAISRSVNSADYANYQRVIGNPGTTGTATPQMISERWNPDALTGTAGAQGLWMNGANDSDVSVQRTLDEHAAAYLNRSQVVVPSYTVTLRPGWYSYGNPSMGDVVPLVIQEGRLNVSMSVRVLGIEYEITDDNAENVSLTLGRPDLTLGDLFTLANADVNALARR
jgi:hypothetical protein